MVARRLVVAVLAVLALAACDDEPASAPPPADRPAGPTPSSALPAPGSPGSPSTAPTPSPVTLAFAGDVHFEGVLGDRLAADPATALAPATRALAAADLGVVNLETAVGTGGAPAPGKQFTFQAPPSALDALAAAGVDVVTLANNHVLDYGLDGLDLDALDAADVDVVGVGRDARAAYAPAVVDIRGTRVEVLGATAAALDPTADPTGQWAATPTRAGTADAVDPRRLLRAVARADASADVVVVYVHWGVQGDTCPSPDQRSLAGALVGAGADVVVGSHAHVLQGDGRLGDGYVAYGLGNFAWYAPGATTGTLTLTVQPGAEPGTARATVTDASWAPGRIGTDGLAGPLPGPDALAFLADRRDLQACAGLSGAS
ncbi:CapA family protein [Nocardioides anomalus]|uniref:CapA family protein n=1 Tax=Nocardioides anomalus TaxID=2712223 RepID=A0A6G6WIG4_9ACTN|nr:CapA family protein [Nocardioides anomalus]QIG44850.1 CapA family protein [Nocardioides anomalus]